MGILRPFLGSPVVPAWRADIGMVFMMVWPGLVVAVGDMPLMLRMVGLLPVLPAWVVMMVVGLPSAEVTSFKMVPAGRGPFV